MNSLESPRSGLQGCRHGSAWALGYTEHIGAVVSQHLEEALTKRFGMEWVARDDGHGFDNKGISGQMMRLFSSRRESITADLRARAARFKQQYGRKPCHPK
jgi:hypothetical protein